MLARMFPLCDTLQILTHLEKEPPQQDPFFERQAGKHFRFEPLPRALHIPLQVTPVLSQVNARDALVLWIWPALQEPGLFHALERVRNRRRPHVHPTSKFRVRDALLLPECVQDKGLASIEANLIPKHVHTGAHEPADLR